MTLYERTNVHPDDRLRVRSHAYFWTGLIMQQVPPADIQWKEVRALEDLPTEERRAYWCRMHSGRICPLVFRGGNWVTWLSFRHPDSSPLAVVAAYAPYTPLSPQTPEEKREYDRKRRRAIKERQEQARQEWIAAGCPKPKKILSRKKK